MFACRSDRLSLTRLGWFTNRLLVWGILIELTIMSLIAYTQIGNDIFGTGPLPLWIFGPLVLGALTLLVAEETRKVLADRMKQRRRFQAERAIAG